MISLIEFETHLMLPKEEAETLGLKYEIPEKIGFDNNNKLGKMDSSSYYYKENCIEVDGKYYADSGKLDSGEEIAYYYLYTKYTGDINYVYIKQSNHLVNLIEFASKCKYKFFIKKSAVSEEPSISNINFTLQQIEEKSTALNKLVDKIKDNTFNEKTNVHVGGGLITTYNDLMLKQDICTDVLQTELNNGWRIIAICNQPDQRRPDYILGRFNPQLEVAEKPDAGR